MAIPISPVYSRPSDLLPASLVALGSEEAISARKR